MFTKFPLTMIAIALLIGLAGCGGTKQPNVNEGSDTSQSGSSNPITDTSAADNYQMLPIISGKAANLQLDASADGTKQQLKKAEVMSITLETNPSTGYSWFATISNTDVLAQMGEPESQAPSESSTPIVGAPEKVTFYFQAADAGTATLTLDYKRGWEQNVAPEKTITITVEVQ